MPRAQRDRPTSRKLAISRACFSGRTDIYGTYDPATGRTWQVKEPVTDEVLLRHLQGRQPYGVYLLVGGRTAAVVADFDDLDAEAPLAYLAQARGYGVQSLLERSKSKGWHAWVFLEQEGLLAWKARALAHGILQDIAAPDTEVFPKHDRLGAGTASGCFIHAPLFGRLVPHSRSVFVDPDCGLTPFPDQWTVLENVQRVSEAQLDELIEINGWARHHSSSPPIGAGRREDVAGRTHGLPPCARRMLAMGVRANQRLSCFRLATQLKKAGLPLDVTEAALHAWAAKNRPVASKEIITPDELRSQVTSAYRNEYRSCGCSDPAVMPFYDQSRCPLGATRYPDLPYTRREDMSEKRPPDREFRAGAIRASIWGDEAEQDGRTYTRHTVKIEKRYRDDRNEWKSTQYFFPNDLPRLALVASKAYEYVVLNGRQDRGEEESEA